MNPTNLESKIIEDLGLDNLNDVKYTDNYVREFAIRAASIFKNVMDKYKDRGEKILPVKNHTVVLAKKVADECIYYNLSPFEIKNIFVQLLSPYISGAYILPHESKKLEDLFDKEAHIEKNYFSKIRVRPDGIKTYRNDPSNHSWKPRNFSDNRDDIPDAIKLLNRDDLKWEISQQLGIVALPSGKIGLEGKKIVTEMANRFANVIDECKHGGQTIIAADYGITSELKKMAYICDNGNFQAKDIFTIFNKAIDPHISLALLKNGEMGDDIMAVARKELGDLINKTPAPANNKWAKYTKSQQPPSQRIFP